MLHYDAEALRNYVLKAYQSTTNYKDYSTILQRLMMNSATFQLYRPACVRSSAIGCRQYFHAHVRKGAAKVGIRQKVAYIDGAFGALIHRMEVDARSLEEAGSFVQFTLGDRPSLRKLLQTIEPKVDIDPRWSLIMCHHAVHECSNKYFNKIYGISFGPRTGLSKRIEKILQPEADPVIRHMADSIHAYAKILLPLARHMERTLSQARKGEGGRKKAYVPIAVCWRVHAQAALFCEAFFAWSDAINVYQAKIAQEELERDSKDKFQRKLLKRLKKNSDDEYIRSTGSRSDC